MDKDFHFKNRTHADFPSPLKDKDRQKDVGGVSWLDDPTRAIFVTMNFVNSPLNLVIQVKVVIAKTDLGLYQMFLTTDRIKMTAMESDSVRNLSIQAVLNIILTLITIKNIEVERSD